MAVPNTNTFTLSDVCDEIGLTGVNRNLVKCFEMANPDGFTNEYVGNKDRLSNFRNYTNTPLIVSGAYTSPNGFSTSNLACVDKTATVYRYFSGNTDSPSIGQILYNSVNLTYPLNGDNLWWYMSPPTGTKYSLKINTSGEVIDKVICGAKPELIFNGTFDTDVNGWSGKYGSTGSITWDSQGFARLNEVDTLIKGLGTTWNCVLGKTYRLEFMYKTEHTESSNKNRMAVWIGNGIGTADEFNKSYYLTASDGWLSASEEFTAGETKSDMIIQFVCYNKAFQIDNVSIREI